VLYGLQSQHLVLVMVPSEPNGEPDNTSAGSLAQRSDAIKLAGHRVGV